MISLSNALLALGGGALIGLAANVLLAGSGRVAGISGIAGRVLQPGQPDRPWRLAFLAGLVLAGIALYPALPESFAATPRPLWVVVPAGLLVGYGTRLGNGCTSGHGVCGMARFSTRSFAAVGVFLAPAVATATLASMLLGGVA